jgi:hypothetical protein
MNSETNASAVQRLAEKLVIFELSGEKRSDVGLFTRGLVLEQAVQGPTMDDM